MCMALRKQSEAVTKPFGGLLSALFGMLLATPVQAQNESVDQGRLIVETRCSACHSLDVNRVGPALGTVWGRVAGKAPDFDYSPALAAASHVWGGDKLLAWLENPEVLVPGQRMGYSLTQAQDRLDVVAYLNRDFYQFK